MQHDLMLYIYLIAQIKLLRVYVPYKTYHTVYCDSWWYTLSEVGCGLGFFDIVCSNKQHPC